MTMSGIGSIVRKPKGALVLQRFGTSVLGFCNVVILLAVCALSAYARDNWKAVKSEHFVVYYLEDKKFAREVAKRAEYYYNKIASDLGYVRYDKFWHWENRVKIYIYSTREHFAVESGVPRKLARGVALYDEKKIIGYRSDVGFLDDLLPHELTHFIFRDFIGIPSAGEGKIPWWIYEGVAQWEEKSKKKKAEELVRRLIKNRTYVPIASLRHINVKRQTDYVLVRTFYAEAITLVGYLIDEYGGRRFTLFCKQLRDGKSLDEALSFVYRKWIRNLDELEKKWLAYYKK